MRLISSSFNDNGIIPRKFGYKYGNFSPSLNIEDIPPSTVSLVLIVDDPDAIGAVGKIWVHWIVYNIDPSNSNFNENSVPPNCLIGINDFGDSGWGGPAPPDKEHKYIFKIYALDTKLEFNNVPSKSDLEKKIDEHIIEQSILTGRFSP